MVFDATVIVPNMSSKTYDIEPVTSSDSSDDDDDDDDSSDNSEADMNDGDNGDAGEEPEEFELTIPLSSGCDYHTPRLDALCIPAEFWRDQGLDRKRTAVLKVVRRGATANEVGLRWKNNAAADARGTLWLKDGWPEFVQAEGRKSADKAYEHDTCFITSIVAACGNQSISIDSNNTTTIRDSSRSNGKALFGFGPNDTIVIEDSEGGEPNKMETIARKAKNVVGRVGQVSSQESSNDHLSRLGYATPNPLPKRTLKLDPLATREEDILAETASSTERIMSKLIRGRMITPKERKLERRYRAFTQMIVCQGVEWDEARCIVRASKQQWEEWRVTIPLSRAYIYYGDDKYEALKRLYASPYAGTLTNPWETRMVLKADEKACPEYDSDYYDEDDEPKYIDTTRNFGCGSVSKLVLDLRNFSFMRFVIIISCVVLTLYYYALVHFLYFVCTPSLVSFAKEIVCQEH
ncbi:hypothetical protein BUALT_Bualt12G0123200 [Buddleja alternifolia]|uniref:Uncharacterized protein n=1 Tax=Buddleja alternifolia TaxID=168488 RepID=A0AAV6WS02_9LAMI|nr:hypothetical protein BUALT_Bualt12G0123200 [Buddleja alternifolia]